jgi:hypothetical protein
MQEVFGATGRGLDHAGGRRDVATMARMGDALGVTVLLTCGIAILATASAVRTRAPRRVVDGLLALEGAGLAAGGLLLLDDVETGSWILAPVALAILVPLHVRALFAGEGPFRT